MNIYISITLMLNLFFNLEMYKSYSFFKPQLSLYITHANQVVSPLTILLTLEKKAVESFLKNIY